MRNNKWLYASLFIFAAFIFLIFFKHPIKSAITDDPEFYVSATIETEPVPSLGDAADDAAIWYNKANPSQSAIIGTDKDGGLVVYDLSGELLQYIPDGEFNNVDIRYNFPLRGEKVALVTAGNRGDSTLGIYKINPRSRRLENVASREIKTVAPYGSCMYQSRVGGKFYYIVNSKNRTVEEWELFERRSKPGKVDAKRVKSFQTSSTPEGCVADDELGHLYIAEQELGIFKYSAEPDTNYNRMLIDITGEGGHLTAQVEGLTLYYMKSGRGYLIASSQGANEFVIYKREGRNKYVATFEVTAGAGIDKVTHTDGLDVTSFPIQPYFPEGFLVVQDHMNDDQYHQNFKIVPWDIIHKKLKKNILSRLM